MKYSVDRIEEDIAVIENIITGEIKEISKDDIMGDVKDGSIIVYSDGKYVLDLEEEKNIKLRIEEKLRRLQRKDN